jgi:hypothetical protein
MSIFKSYINENTYLEEVEIFLNNNSITIPVYTGNRKDLNQSIEAASKLYNSITEPPKYDIGIVITEDKKLAPVNNFIKGFANKWIDLNSVDDSILNGNFSIVICGLYEDFEYSKLGEMILSWFKNKKSQVSFLIGRDVHSLSWMCAKQFAKENALDDVGLFTFKKCTNDYLKDLKEQQDKIKIFDSDSFEEDNIQEILLKNIWKRVIFHGHGKDDNINLGDYTICGNNEYININENNLLPRCGYCNQTCFKDDSKLIPLNKVISSEIIMNSCNNGPFKDLACYDSKFNLLLNAIDGPAKKINSSFTIQNSDNPEIFNCIINNELENIKYPTLLHQSLEDIQIYPSFMEVGLTPVVEEKIEIQRHDRYELVLKTMSRAQKYMVNDFMPKNHPLIKRFEMFNNKANQYILRGKQGLSNEEAKSIEKDWQSKIQSLDYAIAQKIIKDPEDTIMDFESYVMDRSEVDKESVEYLNCTCGNHAMNFTMKGLNNNIFDVDMLFCFKCGDKSVRMEGSPILEVTSQDKISIGESLECNCKIKPIEDGNVMVGYFLPSYIRDYVKVEPKLVKYKNKDNSVIDLNFTIDFQEDIPPQGYYFTVFSIQNFSISVSRQFFGIRGSI